MSSMRYHNRGNNESEVTNTNLTLQKQQQEQQQQQDLHFDEHAKWCGTDTTKQQQQHLALLLIDMERSVKINENFDEGSITMNCKCRRIPMFLMLMIGLCFALVVSNLSLSIQVSSGYNPSLYPNDENRNLSYHDIQSNRKMITRIPLLHDWLYLPNAITTLFGRQDSTPNQLQHHHTEQKQLQNQKASHMTDIDDEFRSKEPTDEISEKVQKTNSIPFRGINPNEPREPRTYSNRGGPTHLKQQPLNNHSESSSIPILTENYSKIVQTRQSKMKMRRNQHQHLVQRQQQRQQQQQRQNGQKTVRANNNINSNQVQRKRKVIPPASLHPDAKFAACLLIKDDNEILSEWIAYHYHTVRMRQLVIAIDPLSTESPRNIIDRWSNNTDLQISIWSDGDYMPHEFIQLNRPPNEYMIKSKPTFTNNDMPLHDDVTSYNTQDVIEISNHRYRQRIFLHACMKHVRDDQKATWLMHIDTDEYIVPSKLVRTRTQSIPTPTTGGALVSSSLIVDDEFPMADISQPGSILRVLQQSVRIAPNLIHYPCIGMPRILFGSKEHDRSLSSSSMSQDTSLDPMKFETIRWIYHEAPDTHKQQSNLDSMNNNKNGAAVTSSYGYAINPKVILDVSAIPARYFANPQEPVFSIHRPFLEFCPANSDVLRSTWSDPTTKIHKQPLAVNHYLGSWERYSQKNDKRRSKLMYDTKNEHASDVLDNDIHPWLQGFINSVGSEAATVLFREYQSTSTTI